jgi:hypothetical protein
MSGKKNGHTDGRTHKQTDRRVNEGIYKQKAGLTNSIGINGQTDRQTEGRVNKQVYEQMNRQKDGQTSRGKNGQRKTDR